MWDVIDDPKTGNILLAMGLDGVLVRSPDGEWSWSAVGGYQFTHVAPSLLYEVVFMFGLIPLYTAIFGWSRRWFQIPLTGFFWLVGAYVMIFYRVEPIMYDRILPPWPWGGFPIIEAAIKLSLPIYALIIGTCFIQVLTVSLLTIKRVFLHLTILFALYLIPYLLWVHGFIPSHFIASMIALGGCTVALGRMFFVTLHKKDA